MAKGNHESKAEAISELVAAYREATSQESAFDALAASTLGIGATDLRCLDLVQANSGMTAGELARASGLTTGAVTAVIDRLTDAGYVRRARSESDRRKVLIEVTDLHYERADRIWGPMFEDWRRTLGREFTREELATIRRFLATTSELGERHAERLRDA